jgi:GT2 family glycosyltransferase
MPERHEPLAVTPDPRVSVVVLSRDRGEELLFTLARLRELPERPEVVVVDNGSTDGSSPRVAATFPEVRLITSPRNLGAAGRTLGVRAARSDYVAFADDDSWWDPGSLRRAADLLDAHPHVGLLAARVLLGEHESVEPACEAMAASPLAGESLPGPRVLGFVACGAVVRRTAYLQVGGFHPRYGVGGEEALLAADMAVAGWRLVYVDGLIARHHPSAVRDRAGRRAGQVRNDLWFAWLRRSPRGAAASTAALLRAAPAEPAVRRGALRALAGLPWVLRERAAVPQEVEDDLRRLDAARD